MTKYLFVLVRKLKIEIILENELRIENLKAVYK